MRYWSQVLMKTKLSIILKNYRGDFSYKISFFFLWLKTANQLKLWQPADLDISRSFSSDLVVQSVWVSSVIDCLFDSCKALTWIKWEHQAVANQMVMMQDDRLSKLSSTNAANPSPFSLDEAIMTFYWPCYWVSVSRGKLSDSCLQAFLRSICRLDCY